MKKLIRNVMIALLIMPALLVLAACSGGDWVGKLTEENFTKIDSTMNYEDVKKILGEADRNFGYLVNYDASKNDSEKQDMIEAVIWFGEDGKVTKVEAKRFTTPPNGGLQTIVWEVNYSA